MDAWRVDLERWDAPSATLDALAMLENPACAVVVTGQQPGVWGGPLYCLYKAATAVAAAARLRRNRRLPAVAVFWMGADDADWDEVAWGAVPRPDLSLYRERWASPLDTSRHWVGSATLGFPEDARTVLESRGPLPRSLGAPTPGELVTLGDGFAGFLLQTLGSEGILVLDARMRALHRAAVPLWQRYLPLRKTLARRVDDQGGRLAPESDPPILPGESERGLFLTDGERREVPDPETWDAEVARRLDAGGDGLAPSVLLRAPLQDYLFGPVAQVVGDGEAAYLRQLQPVYEALAVPAPVRLPRLQATLCPRGLVPRERLAEAVRRPETILGELAREATPPRLREELSGLGCTVRRRLAAVVAESEGFGKDVKEMAASAARRIDQQISRLETTVDRRGRQTLYAREPRLRHLPEFLRPRRRPQDRGLSGVSVELLLGPEGTARVLAGADIHLDRLAEGSIHHLALEYDA